MRIFATVPVTYKKKNYEVQVFVDETTNECAGVEIYRDGELVYADTVPPFKSMSDTKTFDAIMKKTRRFLKKMMP